MKKERYTGISIITFAMLFLVGVAVATYWFQLSYFILVAYAVVSFITFTMYGIDKNAARRGWWRTPEKVLHLMELLCGWPGALIAQQVFRHKSQKLSFKIILWLNIIINILVLVLMNTKYGADFLKSI